MAINEKISVDIVFNPDTKQLEKITKEIGEDNKIKISVDKPDIKQLEGPFKDLQEKFATMANGGFSKGLDQLQQGFAEFKSISGKGGDFFTSAAGGLSKIGSEGAIAVEALAAAAAGAVAAVGALAVGIYALANSSQEQRRTFNALNVDVNAYADSLHGVVDVQEIFNIRNALTTAGVRATAEQMANIVNVSRNLGRGMGNIAQYQELYTQAAAGSIDAIERLGLNIDKTVSAAERGAQALAAIGQRRREQGIDDQTWGDRFGEAWDIIKRKSNEYANSVEDSYDSIFGNEDALTARINQRLARQQATAEQQRREADIARVQNEIAESGDGNRERALILAGASVAQARDGLSVQEQFNQSLLETANNQVEIDRLMAIVPTTTKQVEDIQIRLTGLYQRQAQEQQKRNQLSTFAVKLAEMQSTRLAQQAYAEATHSGQKIRQLTLTQQIVAAEEERRRIIVAALLAGRVLTENENAELARIQAFINQGRQQQAQAAAQEASTRRQNEQTELSMRYANELARARGEAYRLDIDSIDVAQRRAQIEAGLNGLFAYRGNTAQREAARLETIQRLTEQLNNLRGIEEAQQERMNRLRSFEQRRISDSANAGVLRAQLAQSNSDREFANDQARLNQYNDIIQRQQEGIQLTQAETEFLSRYNNATRDRIMLSGLLDARIEQERANSQNQTLTQEQRIAAEERLNQLLAQRIGLQRQEQERSQKQSSLTSKLGKTLEGLAGNYANVGDAAQGLGSMALNQLGSAFSNMISTVIEGKVSFGEALAEMAKSMLASLAQMAGSQALFQLATGFAKLAINDIPGSTAAFTSAGMFAAVAAVAGGISAAIPSSNQQSGGGGGSSGGVSTPTTSTPESSSRNSGPMVINVNVNGSLSTDKDIQKAVAHSVYAYEERMGTRRR